MRIQEIELSQIELPEYGEATVEPTIPASEYEARIAALRARAEAAEVDVVVVYADREHSANLAFLTAFDPRFEEALLIVAKGYRPLLLVGNEGWDYAKVSPLDLDVQLYQPFSLLGQDRSRSKSIRALLGEVGVGKGTRVGVVDWKYFEAATGPDAALLINAPAYLVDTLRQITGEPVINVTAWLMDAKEGLRAINSVDQLAAFEFAATCISNSMRRLLRALQPGKSEIEVMRAAQHPGLPNSMHPIIISGPRAALALASPSMRMMQLGEPISCAMGVWGALNARAGFLVHDASELPEGIRDYVDRLVAPYFAAITEWYSTVGIGVAGGDMYALVKRHLGDPFFGVGLNPGHLIHLDEWLHSPIFAGSTQTLRAGMGAHFVIPIEERVELAARLVETPTPTCALTLDGAQSLYQTDLRGDVIFMFGNEGAGLSDALAALAGTRVSIPMRGAVESLNVAAAVSVCCFEKMRQELFSAAK